MSCMRMRRRRNCASTLSPATLLKRSCAGSDARPCAIIAVLLGRVATPVRGGGARRWAPFGRIHTGGDGRHTARGCVEAVGVVCPTSRPATKCVVVRRPVDVDRTYQDLSLDMVRNTRRISTLTPSAGHHWWYGNFAPVTEFLNTATSERI